MTSKCLNIKGDDYNCLWQITITYIWDKESHWDESNSLASMWGAY
jgi:hypothetical protein